MHWFKGESVSLEFFVSKNNIQREPIIHNTIIYNIKWIKAKMTYKWASKIHRNPNQSPFFALLPSNQNNSNKSTRQCLKLLRLIIWYDLIHFSTKSLHFIRFRFFRCVDAHILIHFKLIFISWICFLHFKYFKHFSHFLLPSPFNWYALFISKTYPIFCNVMKNSEKISFTFCHSIEKYSTVFDKSQLNKL